MVKFLLFDRFLITCFLASHYALIQSAIFITSCVLSTHLKKRSFKNNSCYFSVQKLAVTMYVTQGKKLHLSMTYKSLYDLSPLPMRLFILLYLSLFNSVQTIFFFFLFLKNSPNILILRLLSQTFLLSLPQISFIANTSIFFKSFLKLLFLNDTFNTDPFYTGTAHLPSHYPQELLILLTSLSHFFPHSTS